MASREAFDGIAAALPDSKDRVRQRARARVPAEMSPGLFKCKMRPMREFELWRYLFGAPWLVEAEDTARGGADAEVEFLWLAATTQVDRMQAKLRHVRSILVGSCSTLLIGPAITCGQVDRHATAPEDVLMWRVQKWTDKLWRECEQQPPVPLRARADADEASSTMGGSHSGRWQGHLYSPPFWHLDSSDSLKLGVRAQGEEISECGGLFITRAFSQRMNHFTGPPFSLAKLHPDGESYGRVPPNMPHPPLPPNPPTGRPNAPARTTFPSARPRPLPH